MRPVICLLLVGSAGLAAGCGTKPTKGTVSQAAKTADDPWPGAVVALRKEATAGGIARVLGELTAATAAEPKYAADGLAPAAEAAVKDLARLTDADLKVIRPTGYSSLDPHYLAECLYLRDVARSLEVDGLPPAKQAEAAFAWVCRQVVLLPWVGGAATSSPGAVYPPVPPSYVLRRGSGSGLERATVVLALCQQLGLDGVLVGPPDAADQTWKDDPTPNANQVPRGPFWAVGVRAGGDVLLFDPWRGEPFAGPDGKGVLTLAQAVANPDTAKAAGVPAERVKTSVPFLSVPLSALASRLKRLEAELKADTGVRLFVDLPAVVKGFAEATKVSPKVWNPPGDPFNYPRVLAGFIPPADGGSSPAPNLLIEFKASQLPPGLLRTPFAPGLLPDPADPTALGSPDTHQLLQAESVNRIGSQFLLDPSPRERAQRGQPEAIKLLVGLRDEYQKGQERLRTDRDRDRLVREWVATAQDRSRKIAAARDRNPAALAEAQQAFQQFWKETTRVWTALVDLAVAETGVAEATFQLALVKHEQAERAEQRADRLKTDDARRRAADAWTEARDWWARFTPLGGAVPGRGEHARRLAERAAARAGG